MVKNYLIPLLILLLCSCEKNQDEIIIKYYGDASEDIGYSIAPTADGYVIGGQLTKVARLGSNYININESIKKTGIIRTNSQGYTIWKDNKYGNRLPGTVSKILSLDDGTIIGTGYVTDTVTNEKDVFVVKTDADNNNPVEMRYELGGNQAGTDIIQTTEGFMILASTDLAREVFNDSTGNTAGKKDIIFLRIKSNLEKIAFSNAFGFPGNDAGVAIKNDINGGYVVVGTTDRSDKKTEVQKGTNIIICRINSTGVATQHKIIGGLPDESAADFEVLNDGYFIAGTIGAEGTIQKANAWLLSSDIYSAPLNDNIIDIGVESSVSIKAICKYRTSSFIMAGQSGTGSSSRMLFFVTNATGSYEEGTRRIFGGTGSQTAYDVISDSENNVISVGKNSYENNTMISLIKFRF